MPIYIYKCPTCGAEKEIIHKINENPKIVCENCKVKEIEKLNKERIMKRILFPSSFRINGYFTSQTGYSKNKKYMEAVERKKKSEKKK